MSGTDQVVADSVATTVTPNWTHHGQGRGQKTGPPVRRRIGDEIVLLHSGNRSDSNLNLLSDQVTRSAVW